MRPVNATGPKRGRIGRYPVKTGGGAQSGLSALINMFAPGVPVSPGHAQALNEILPK